MTIDSGVGLLTLNRPQARNALDTAIVRDLQNALVELAALPDFRACVLTGAGSAFSAGADLKERQGMTLDEQERSTREIRRCADLLEELPLPTIAPINGPAYAGGLELAIACDIRIASATARFAFPEVKVGIFP